MRFRTKFFAWVVVMSLVLMIGVSTIPQAKAQFIIAELGSNFPDEYGQGIKNVYLYENSTGAWVAIFPSEVLTFPENNSDTTITLNYTENTAIELIIGCSINHTYHGLSTFQEALDMMRVNITVYSVGQTIFSQNNLTWGGGLFFNDTASTWRTHFEVVINVLITTSSIYTVFVTYEVFY